MSTDNGGSNLQEEKLLTHLKALLPVTSSIEPATNKFGSLLVDEDKQVPDLCRSVDAQLKHLTSRNTIY